MKHQLCVGAKKIGCTDSHHPNETKLWRNSFSLNALVQLPHITKRFCATVKNYSSYKASLHS